MAVWNDALGLIWVPPDKGFPGGTSGKKHTHTHKNPLANSGDTGLIPGSGRSLGEGNGNPFQYSCLENPMGRGAWQAIVCGVTKIDMTEWLSTHSTGAFYGLPRWHSGKEFICQCRRHRRRGFAPWGGKMPCRRKWQPTLIFLLGKSHG